MLSSPTVRENAMSKGTVLVVDDDATILDLVQLALEDGGYCVLVSIDGAALRLAHEQQPDLILMDLMMPEMDGREVTTRLRADSATAHIPIIVLSARRNLTHWTAGMQVDGTLDKPFDLDDLSSIVGHWVAEGRRRRDTAAPRRGYAPTANQ